MRKLIMWNLITLDGMFEGKKSWDLGWHEYVWGPELEQISIDQLHSADMLMFGRKTYQGMAEYWQTAKGTVADLMNNIPKIVISRTLTNAEWNRTRLVQHNEVQEIVTLKKEGNGNIFIFGSAELSASLMKHGLFDEFRLALCPVVLGHGTPLFKAATEHLRLDLLESRQLSSGCVILRYRPSGQTNTDIR